MKSYLFSRSAIVTLALLVLLNVTTIQSATFGAILLLIFSILSSIRLGYAFTKSTQLTHQFATGALMLLSLIALSGSAIYYLAEIPGEFFYVLFGLLSTGLALLKNPKLEQSAPRNEVRFLAGGIVAALTLTLIIRTVSQEVITEATKTPWDSINPVALLCMFFAALLIVALSVRKQSRASQLILLSALLLTATSIAAILYPIGYGFDPFVHRATIARIAEFGTIAPKPFYYIGQYSIELFAHHVFSLPIKAIDTWLVPILSSLLLPVTAFIGLSSITRKYALFGAASTLLVPFSLFVSTTPQSFAYIVTLASVFLVLPLLKKPKGKRPIVLLGSLAATSLIIHPIAGIPAVIFWILFSVQYIKATLWKRLATAFTVFASCFIFPVAFFAQSALSGLQISLALPATSWPISPINQFSPLLDLLYLPLSFQLPILLVGGLIGTILVLRSIISKRVLLPALLSAVLLVNYVLMQFVSFDFLIEYERQNYTDRILILAVLFALPTFAIALMKLKEKLNHLPKPYTIAFLAAFALLVTANFYGAVPRNDTHAVSRSFNVSETDIEAVQWIETHASQERADNENYAVLANQMVSAAALQEYGFKTYHRDNTAFYYPVPTSDLFYSFYLTMTEEGPSKETAIAAMDYMGVDTLYFVVNSYWTNATNTSEQAKSTSDEWIAIGENSELVVFVFSRLAN